MATTRVTYEFRRSQTSSGRRERASTDALTLLSHWANADDGRAYEVVFDSDAQSRADPDLLVANLSIQGTRWELVPGEFDGMCEQFGLHRTVVPDRD